MSLSVETADRGGRGDERFRAAIHRRRTASFGVILFSIAAVLCVSEWVVASDGEHVGITNAARPGGLLDTILFYIVAMGTVVSAVGICVTKNIVRMAVWLFMALGSVAMMYFLLAANFLGAVQLIVYAGGTLVLLIFGVMLTAKSPWVRFEARLGEVVAAFVVCVGLLVTLSLILVKTRWHSPEGIVPGASLADLGRQLLTTYLVPFEVAGVLLFIVMVGAAHLARQDR